ncbi:MAG: alpha/beta hydrolase [Planctomycetota bacterium]|nr:alpha/beta hydrolase [Planctomycetota bacterium]
MFHFKTNLTVLVFIWAFDANFALAQAEDAKPKTGGSFEAEIFRNISYFDDKDADPKKHKLDLFLPKGHKNYPVLFFIHGGGWTSGDRWQYGMVGRVFAKNGVGVVLISYRLSPQVQRADQIFISGQSAGGHLAALLATNQEFLKAQNLTLKNIKGVMPMSGFYTFEFWSNESVIGKGKEAMESASPIKHISGKEPPFIIIYAEKDLPGCEKMSHDFCDALKSKKVEAECIKIKDRNHVSIMFKLMMSETDPTTQALLKFISKHSGLKLSPKKESDSLEDENNRVDGFK